MTKAIIVLLVVLIIDDGDVDDVLIFQMDVIVIGASFSDVTMAAGLRTKL